MVVPDLSNQEKIDQLIAEMHGQAVIFQKLCQLMFAVIDRFCERRPAKTGPGRRPTYPDQDILKIDMLMHLTGKRGETEILREIERHYQAYFAQVPGQSRLWYRIRQALPLIEQFRGYLRDKLGLVWNRSVSWIVARSQWLWRTLARGEAMASIWLREVIVPAKNSLTWALSWGC